MPENRVISKAIGLVVFILVIVALFVVFGLHLGTAASLVVWLMVFLAALAFAIFLL